MKHLICHAFVLIAVTASAFSAHAFPRKEQPYLQIREVQSTSGIKAWLVEDHTLPIISIAFALKTYGTNNDPTDAEGLGQMLSNTMDEGAGNYSSTDFQKALNDNAISLSFQTTRDTFSGVFKTLSANKEEAFKLLKLSLNQPTFPEDAITRMRNANETRLRNSVTDPDWQVSRLFYAHIFAGHPYARNSGGTFSGLKNVNQTKLKQAFKDIQNPTELRIAVAGDITEEQLTQLLENIFGTWKQPAKDTRTNVPDFTLPEQGSSVLFAAKTPQTLMRIALPGIKVSDPDYAAAVVMNNIFGGAGFGSRLMTDVREKKGLTYGIYSSLNEMDHAALLTIGTSTKNETAAEMLSSIKQVMKTMRDGKVTDDELTQSKSYLIGSLPLSMTSLDRTTNLLLSFQMSDLKTNYLDDYVAAIRAVTKEDVQRLAQKLLVENRMQIVMVGAPQNLKPDAEITKLPGVE